MSVVIDAGPLIAIADAGDKHHQRCVEVIEDLPRPIVLPTTVLAEICHLVERQLGPGGEAAFLDSLDDGTFALATLTFRDVRRMAELVRAYASLRLGGVDASVVAVAERLGIAEVLTLDQRHFTVVRPRHVSAFRLLPE